MTDRSRELARQNEEAILNYRKAGFAIYHLPAPDNDKWFEELMRKYEIPPVYEMELSEKKITVVMVND